MEFKIGERVKVKNWSELPERDVQGNRISWGDDFFRRHGGKIIILKEKRNDNDAERYSAIRERDNHRINSVRYDALKKLNYLPEDLFQIDY